MAHVAAKLTWFYGQAGILAMAKGSPGLDPCVIVVGDPRSEWTREMVRLAQEYEVEPVSCDNAYAAAARLASTGRRTFLVGRMRDLTREEGRLLALAARNDVPCCCLVEKDALVRHHGVRAALRAGVSLIFETPEARAVIEDWLARGPRRALCLEVSGLPEENVRPTEAELGALLGPPRGG